jgi:NADH:ubiquinone oxidoreductase subunit D
MWTWGIKIPPGEVYSAVEGGNGELGFHVISSGDDRPYRVHCRPPCMMPLAAVPLMIKDRLIADIVPTFGMVNMIAGELDR